MDTEDTEEKSINFFLLFSRQIIFLALFSNTSHIEFFPNSCTFNTVEKNDIFALNKNVPKFIFYFLFLFVENHLAIRNFNIMSTQLDNRYKY
jgi:hypothetical protein